MEKNNYDASILETLKNIANNKSMRDSLNKEFQEKWADSIINLEHMDAYPEGLIVDGWIIDDYHEDFKKKVGYWDKSKLSIVHPYAVQCMLGMCDQMPSLITKTGESFLKQKFQPLFVENIERADFIIEDDEWAPREIEWWVIYTADIKFYISPLLNKVCFTYRKNDPDDYGMFFDETIPDIEAFLERQALKEKGLPPVIQQYQNQ